MRLLISDAHRTHGASWADRTHRDAYERMRVSGRRLPWQQAEQRLREIEAGTFEVSDPFQE